MATKDIQQYLEANSGKYPPELLVAELRKAGHAENEIQEALRTLGVGPVAPSQGGAGVITAWGKVWRFGLGFLSGGFISFALIAAIVAVSLFGFPDIMARFDYGTVSFGLADGWYVLLGIAALIALTIPTWLFFRLRAEMLYFARGVLAGSALTTLFVIGFAIFFLLSLRGSW